MFILKEMNRFLVLAILGVPIFGCGGTDIGPVSIDVSPSVISLGEHTTVYWWSEPGSTFWSSSFGADTPNGSMSVLPSRSDSYTITIRTPAGLLKSATIMVLVNDR